MSPAWPVVIATSGWTRAQAIRLLRPLTPGLKQAGLNACFVFSCLELVFCFMDYRNLLVRSVCQHMRARLPALKNNSVFARLQVKLIVWVCNVSEPPGLNPPDTHDDIHLRCVSGDLYKVCSDIM